MTFVGEPLHAFAEGIHIGKLENVDGHDDLIEQEVAHSLAC
jgi:hypothetical protein